MADLECSKYTATSALPATAAAAASGGAGGGDGAAAAGGAACASVLRESAWLRPSGANDTRGAWLAMSLARDAYPKMHLTPDGAPMTDTPALKCAWAAKLSRMGAQNVTFLSSALVNAAVARAGRNVFVVIRGTDSEAEEENNGLWAADEALLWYRLVRVHGGFLSTSRHALPALVGLLQEAFGQVRAEAGQQQQQQQQQQQSGPANASAAGASGAASGAPEPRLYLMGHSRGGGLATVMAAQLDSGHYITVGRYIAGVYTFGAPKVGNKKFVQGYAWRLGKITYAWW